MALKCGSCDYPYVPNSGKCPNCGAKNHSGGCFGMIILFILLVVWNLKCNGDASHQTNTTNNSPIKPIQQQEYPEDSAAEYVYQKDSAAEYVYQEYQIDSAADAYSDGEIVQISKNLPSDESQSSYIQNRDPRGKELANVYYNPEYSLYDVVTDELIVPNNEGIYNIYYSSYKDPTPKSFVGNANELSNLRLWKFSNFENCKKWCDENSL